MTQNAMIAPKIHVVLAGRPNIARSRSFEGVIRQAQRLIEHIYAEEHILL